MSIGPAMLAALYLWPVAAHAMDLYHYDLDSLNYMSTDVVVGTVSVKREQKFTVTVNDTVYGAVAAGEKLETLSDFLGLFQPMEDGQQVIMFLDRRPHRIHFLYPEAAKSPLVVAPSGVYLIDIYQHVHEYWQQDNPGPYVADGYTVFPSRSVPAKEADLALPSLAEVRKRILASLRSVEPIRALLDKTVERGDASALVSLLDARFHSGGRGSDAIAERATQQVRSLNDPELLLRIYPIAADTSFALDFIQPTSGESDKPFTSARVKYLLRTLADPKRGRPLRVAAVEILLQLSRFHSGRQTGPSKTLPIDNEWLADSAAEIQSAARAIFDAEPEDGHLRSLCLQFLNLGAPEVVAGVHRVYVRTQSQELRFAIEEAFLEIGDALYQSLEPPGGPVASRVAPAAETRWQKPGAGKIRFAAEYYVRQDFWQRSLEARRYFVLTNSQTGQRTVFETNQSWNGGRNGEDWIELSQRSELAVGNYVLAFEYSDDGKILSSGYKLGLAVRDTPAGRRLSVVEQDQS